jgi:methylenetetrahydrofolate dehydrogenase (NADP+)/methenyltetrahydrofolate cyclohydrolase
VIIDGKALAADIVESLAQKNMHGLKLGVLMSAGDAATESFIRIKSRVAERLGVTVVRRELAADATEVEELQALQELVEATQGIILQLPLPRVTDTAKLIEALPASHNVDGLTTNASVRPPVAEAVQHILSISNVEAQGKNAVVLGAGRLVGAPSAVLLRELGANVTTLVNGDSLVALQEADIVVLGAGEPGIVKPEMLKDGVVLIDAGTSESAGKLMGDADPACAEVASIYTPVPGGVGPIAVAMIFKNLFALAGEC